MKPVRRIAGAALGAALLNARSGGGESGPSARSIPPFRARAPHLYVANSYNDTVTVYASNGTSPLRTIETGVHRPTAIAFDTGGSLYVADWADSAVTLYPPGTTSVSRKITEGVKRPVALALDQSGYLFVANFSNYTVTEYARSVKVSRTRSRSPLGRELAAHQPVP